MKFTFLFIVSFCHCVFLSWVVLVHLQFISFYISSLEFAWKTSESFLLPFGIFVFLSYCLSIIVSFCLTSSLFIFIHLTSSQFIGHPSSFRFILLLSQRCRAISGLGWDGMVGWTDHWSSLFIGILRTPSVVISQAKQFVLHSRLSLF